MVSFLSIALTLLLRSTLGWSYFEPPKWSPAPCWARCLIIVATLLWASRIDVSPHTTPKMVILVETIVAYDLLDLVVYGAWGSVEPLIHRAVLSKCLDWGMSGEAFLHHEWLILGLATTAVAATLCCLLPKLYGFLKPEWILLAVFLVFMVYGSVY
ncbi:GL19560 [Drosophila persimilis]|uniref:GL19560 n=1 Tax=Drosophila persimilis TaxID=7234 RepID=B4G6P1_DROPE|nr:uncharacterized protein LOC6589848 [Drosophila persimilis]EDW29155.1 GL19560 [Drosophila persimilis]